MSYEFEGTWEEVASHCSEFSGKMVRVEVLGREARDRVLNDPSGAVFLNDVDPVADVDAFLESLPKFSDEDVESLMEAIADNRSGRRRLAEERG